MNARSRRARWALACVTVCGAAWGCISRKPSHADASRADRPIDRPLPPPPDVPRVTTGARGPWRDLRLLSAAVSNATQGASPTEVLGAVALPDEDLAHAELRLVRWGDQGAEIIARHAVTGMIPGGAMGLLRGAQGYTVVWFPPPGDGGVPEGRAIDAVGSGFTSYERSATPAEVEAAAWARDALVRRAREKVDEPAPAVTAGGHSVRIVEARRQPAVVRFDEQEITRGADLLGYQRAVGLGVAPGGRAWVAVLRGHCRETRVEVYRVAGTDVVLRGSFAVGAEVGVRWVHVDARDDSAAVTWYQDLIPIRIDCTRGDGGTSTADHGVRVAYVDDRGG